MSKAKWGGGCDRLAVAGSRWSERSKRSRNGMRRSGEGVTFWQAGKITHAIVAGAAAAAIARAIAV
jgi:hypothetical protein